MVVDPFWSGILAFQYFMVWHFSNSDDKESRLFSLKTLKSQNVTGLWSRVVVTEEAISAFQYFGVRIEEEAVILESIFSNSRFVKS
jgi:hypothetical protein